MKEKEKGKGREEKRKRKERKGYAKAQVQVHQTQKHARQGSLPHVSVRCDDQNKLPYWTIQLWYTRELSISTYQTFSISLSCDLRLEDFLLLKSLTFRRLGHRKGLGMTSKQRGQRLNEKCFSIPLS